jgi:hypothetical protein
MAATTDGKRAKRSARMFETPLIEFFSHIHPGSPFVFWLPVVFVMPPLRAIWKDSAAIMMHAWMLLACSQHVLIPAGVPSVR